MVDLTTTTMSNIKKVKGGFDDKMKALIKNSTKNLAEVGWFAQDGKHPDADMTYPELAKYHATGQDGVVPRDVLRIALRKFNPSQYQQIKVALGRLLIEGKVEAYDKLVEAIGEGYWEKAYSIIGNPAALPVTNNPTPLKDSGALKGHLGRRTTKNKIIKRGSV